MWSASDVVWVVGHSYIVYAPLLVGATTVLFEGKPVGTPDAGALWRVIADHRVDTLFTAPTALRAIRKVDPDATLLADYDTTSLRTLFTAGERLDPATYAWGGDTLNVPVVDHWWQTETGWPVCANLRGFELMPTKPGSPSVPVPGFRLAILDDDGRALTESGQEGTIALKLPLPPGTLTGLWNDSHRFTSSYLMAFDGFYDTGDSGYVDDDGYLFVLGRTDDVINMAGHRLSIGRLEAVIASHPAIAENTVIGVPDELKGQHPSTYIVLKSGSWIDSSTLRHELATLVRQQVGAIAALHD